MASATETFHRRDFWLGDLDARVPALFRTGLGILVAADLVDRLRDVHSFYTRAGMVAKPLDIQRWSVFHLASTPGQTLALFMGGLVLAAAFAVGYRTRLACVLLWAFMVSLFHANPFVCDGGDATVLVLLFWAMFIDLGAAHSADVRWGRRPALRSVPAGPVRMLQLQIAYIYALTFLSKWGPTWWSGQAVWLTVSNPDWSRGLGPLLAQHPAACAALTWFTLAFEAAFPFLVFWPGRQAGARAVALAAGVFLHIGIFVTLRVGIFSQAMPVSFLIFLPVAWLEGWRLPRGAMSTTSLWARKALLAILAAQLGLILAAQLWLTLRGRPAPWLARELSLLGHHQGWSMFAPDVPRARLEVRMPGVLVDGRTVDVLETVVPELKSPRGFVYRRWHKLRQSLLSQPHEALVALGRTVCRRYNGEQAGPKLERFRLEVRPVSLRDPGPPPPFEVLLRQPCLPAAVGSAPDEAQNGAHVPDGPDPVGR